LFERHSDTLHALPRRRRTLRDRESACARVHRWRRGYPHSSNPAMKKSDGVGRGEAKVVPADFHLVIVRRCAFWRSHRASVSRHDCAPRMVAKPRWTIASQTLRKALVRSAP
jgi:hypothetical protein